MLVRELLTLDPVSVVYTKIPSQYGAGLVAKVGKAEVQWRSWTPLRKRLQAAGYRLTLQDDTITMSVPDYNLVPSDIMR